MVTEGRDRDLTWMQTLPNDALRCYVKHSMDLGRGVYRAEIKGALASIGQEKYSTEKFQKCSRVTTLFTTPFSIAYDSLVSARAAAEKNEEGGNNDENSKGKVAESASFEEFNIPESQKAENKEINRQGDLARFRQTCAEHCEVEINSRLVTMVATGESVETQNTVTNTRLYQNLTDSVAFMGLYDVKNARLCNTYDGEGDIVFTVLQTSHSKHCLSCRHVSSVPF